MKTYIYEKKFFNVEVVMTGVICILLAIFAAVMMLMKTLVIVFAIVFVVCCYQIINTYFTNSNPEIITISEDTITLSSFNRKDVYRFDEIHSFKVREIGGNKFYVRINNTSMTKGRYWIQAQRMNDKEELKQWIYDFEAKIHPESLRVQAVQSSIKYSKIKKEKENAGKNN